MTTDDYLFTERPSQLLVIGWLIAAIAVVWFIPILASILAATWIWKMIVLSCWSFQFHERTIQEQRGVFNRRRREAHYFRVKSVSVNEPLFLRILGLYDVDLITSDPLAPVMRIHGVPKENNKLRETVKERIRYWRDEMHVKEQDFHRF